jgi:threonine/homoserine/homoserine lactone efflux protein
VRDLDAIAAFLTVAAVVIVTPGPDTALTVRNTLLGGRRSGVFTAIGVSAGQTAWTLATSAGIAAVLAASRPAFTAVKLAGAAYLVYLGVQALYAALARPGAASAAGVVDPAAHRLAPPRAFRQGVVSNLANPKMAAFFPALLPQFAPDERSGFLALLALGLTFAFMTLVWLTAYAFAVARVGNVLRRPSVRRILEAVTGVVLTALGLRLATQRG